VVASGLRDVLQVGCDARATVNGDEPDLLLHGWVAHTSMRNPARAGGTQARSDQPRSSKRRMRLLFVLREVRANWSIDGVEERVFAMGCSQRSRMRSSERLMALLVGDSHTCTSIRPSAVKSMTLRLDFAGLLRRRTWPDALSYSFEGREARFAAGIHRCLCR